MKVATYGTLPMGTVFMLRFGDGTHGVKLYKKGEYTDFDETGVAHPAEKDTASVFLVDKHDGSEKRNKVWSLVELELASAQRNHPPMNSHHEAYGVILEEVDEYWAEVKKKDKDRRPSEVRAELVQIAAMACRAIIDLDLL